MSADTSRLDLLLYLNSLGDVVNLRPYADPHLLLKEISAFDDHWHLYNPSKPGYQRWGLSVTSLDGGLSGEPDLYSLKEYNSTKGTEYCENDFTTPTPVYHGSITLRNALDPFGKLGRTHFLKLGRGGFFPPHRDNALIDPECFRLFINLNYNQDAYSFVINGQQRLFEAGHLYLVNTSLAHSLFSFHEFTYFVVVNVPLTRDHVERVNRVLSQD